MLVVNILFFNLQNICTYSVKYIWNKIIISSVGVVVVVAALINNNIKGWETDFYPTFLWTLNFSRIHYHQMLLFFFCRRHFLSLYVTSRNTLNLSTYLSWAYNAMEHYSKGTFNLHSIFWNRKKFNIWKKRGNRLTAVKCRNIHLKNIYLWIFFFRFTFFCIPFYSVQK